MPKTAIGTYRLPEAKRRNQYTKRPAAPGMKVCCRCEIEKPIAEYTKNRAKPDGLDARCKECKKEVREIRREYNSAYGKKWREENRGYVEMYRKCYSDTHRLEENARLRVQAAKRRKILAENFIEEVDYNKILERDNYMCHICNKPVEPQDVHFDHVVPLSKGGAHSMENVKVAHSACNLRKGNKVTPSLKGA